MIYPARFTDGHVVCTRERESLQADGRVVEEIVDGRSNLRGGSWSESQGWCFTAQYCGEKGCQLMESVAAR